jgi:hypothetical protein
MVFKEIDMGGMGERRNWDSGCAGGLVDRSDKARPEEIRKGFLKNIDSPTCVISCSKSE